MKKLLTGMFVLMIVAVSVHDLILPVQMEAQSSDCDGRGRHCLDVEDCADAAGFVDIIIEKIFGVNLSVCVTNHYYYPERD